jgi:hypothetical protein
MTETKSDPTKGKKYRARINVSFGKARPHVLAGEVFHLDDPELAKKLLAEGSITEDLKGEEEEDKPGEATFTDPSKPPHNVTKNAAETAGAAADAHKKK